MRSSDGAYDLLDEGERALLRRIGIFRGGCSLASATAVCDGDGADEWQMLDVLASLADKSLLVVESGDAQKRYGQLESIREYARDKMREDGELQATAQRHSEVFAATARAAYEEWDTAPGPDWLSRLSPDIDNFRAALSFAIDEDGDRVLGAQMAADLGPVFMRMSLLREGVEWCDRALAAAPEAPAEVRARAEYLLSMLHYNRGEMKTALEAAERAARFFEKTQDERGTTRALSQLAQLYQRVSRGEEARAVAEEAVRRARTLGDRRLLAAVLQRCAITFEPKDIDLARAQFFECLSIFRSLGSDDDIARALIWWSGAEAEAECYTQARDLSLQALGHVGTSDSAMYLKSNVAFFSLVLGDENDARSNAYEALELAAQARNPMIVPIALSYIAVLLTNGDPELGARLIGYAESRLAALEWTFTPSETKTHAKLQTPLRAKFTQDRMNGLLAEGASLNEDRAVALALGARC